MERLHAMHGLAPRVHAAAFGFSEPEHVTQPLRLMRADAFFLLEAKNDRAFKRHMKGGVNVHELLDATEVPWERVEVDLWSPAAVGAALQAIIREHRLSELMVNASVGPNTVAIGATLASLFAPVQLFHPGGEDPSKPMASLHEVIMLPSFHVKGWKGQHISLLNALIELGGSGSGTELKQHLREHAPDVIGRGGGAGNWAQREHAKFQALTEFLVDSGAITVDTSHRRWHVELTDSGRHMATLLCGLSEGDGGHCITAM